MPCQENEGNGVDMFIGIQLPGDPNQDLPLFQDPHCLQGKAFAEAKSVDVATHHRNLQVHLEPY